MKENLSKISKFPKISENFRRYSKAAITAGVITVTSYAGGGSNEVNTQGLNTHNRNILPYSGQYFDNAGETENIQTPLHTSSPLPRNDCDLMRDTLYEVEGEREFFQENCITPTPIPNANSLQATTSSKERGITATYLHDSLAGNSLGCGTGNYNPENPTIAAVSPTRYREWPCGTEITITNPANGITLNVVRHDSCPGCGHNHIDLSRAALRTLCGGTDCGKLTGLIVSGN